MSALSDLKDKYVLDAGTLTDTREQLEALSLIDEWYLCATASGKLSSTDILSYTISGRTVTRRDIPQLAQRADELAARIRSMLYGGSSGFADHRYTTLDT